MGYKVLVTDEIDSIAVKITPVLSLPSIAGLTPQRQTRDGARVAAALSGENINISMMQVGRKVRGQAGGESVMVLSVDEPVSAAVLLRLQNIERIYDAHYVNLNTK